MVVLEEPEQEVDKRLQVAPDSVEQEFGGRLGRIVLWVGPQGFDSHEPKNCYGLGLASVWRTMRRLAHMTAFGESLLVLRDNTVRRRYRACNIPYDGVIVTWHLLFWRTRRLVLASSTLGGIDWAGLNRMSSSKDQDAKGRNEERGAQLPRPRRLELHGHSLDGIGSYYELHESGWSTDQQSEVPFHRSASPRPYWEATKGKPNVRKLWLLLKR